MAPVHFEVVTADVLDDTVRAEIIKLCESAYGEDFSRLFNELPGSIHILARDACGELVSHAEWVTRWLQPAAHPALRTAYVEAVATAQKQQGQGPRCFGASTMFLRRIRHGSLVHCLPQIPPSMLVSGGSSGGAHWRSVAIAASNRRLRTSGS
jgi:hypothetical protein